MSIKDKIRTIPNYPKDGIMFRDITTLIADPIAFKETIDAFLAFSKTIEFDIISGIEARGFIFAPVLAYLLKKPFVPIRKKGKLPGKVLSQSYNLEYGVDTIEIHQDAIKPSQKVWLIDDLLATGGTALAAYKLINQTGGIVRHAAFVVDLPDLKGKNRLEESGLQVHCLVEFDGD